MKYNPAAIIINDKGEQIVKSCLVFDVGIFAVRLNLFGDAVHFLATSCMARSCMAIGTANSRAARLNI